MQYTKSAPLEDHSNGTSPIGYHFLLVVSKNCMYVMHHFYVVTILSVCSVEMTH